MSDLDKRRLALGDQLRELRHGSGLSGKRLAEQAGWPASKVSRIENARQSISDSDVRTWCDITGAADSVAAQLRDQLRGLRLDEANRQRRLRSARRSGPAADGQRSQEIEQSASTIRIFELASVPTLVQTAEYARYVFAASGSHTGASEAEVDVQTWMERQRVLYAPGKRIEITLAESALRYPVCPTDVLRAQIDRLLALQGLPGLRLGVIPLDTRLPVLPMHGFWILDDVVLIKTLTSEILIQDERARIIYQRLADALAAVALTGDGVRGLLSRLARQLSTT
ncbi:MAG TPA: helix-turn-helix transcriptional regulator [Pseudonocardiaceae bacterium]|jgi:transcriptional regulator with XRE-family HTH domain